MGAPRDEGIHVECLFLIGLFAVYDGDFVAFLEWERLQDFLSKVL